jgi:hypothetical protein
MTTEKPTERSGRTRKNAADDPADTEEQDPGTEEPDGTPELSYRARQRIRTRLVRKYH